MNLSSIKPADVVEVDKKGRRFIAIVTGIGERGVDVRPVDRRITYRQATAREVVGIWHANKATKARYS